MGKLPRFVLWVGFVVLCGSFPVWVLFGGTFTSCLTRSFAVVLGVGVLRSAWELDDVWRSI